MTVARSLRCFLLAAALLPAAAYAAPATPDAATRLHKLFADTDEGLLKRNPVQALYRGDLRYADQIGDLYSDAHYAGEKAADEDALKQLSAIPRASLDPTDQIAYDTFKRNTEIDLEGYRPDLLKIAEVMPINHFYGLHLDYADLSSGQGAAPFKTAKDYEDALKRHAQYPKLVDDVIARFRQGLAAGIVEPKLVVNNMIDELTLQSANGVEGTPYYGPVKAFPDTIPAADQARLRAAYTATIRDGIMPANAKLLAFLKTEYLPHARDTVGLGGLPGGKAYYDYLIEQNTTLPMTAEQVHQLGLNEVARITKELEAVKAKVGFKGDLHAFFQYMTTDPKFAPPSRDWLQTRYRQIQARIDQRIPEQFSLVPKTPFEIRAEPAYKEKSSAAGEYMQGSADGTRPGVFYYNGYDLPTRFTWGEETLFLHEAIPGHHFQISLAQENTKLPNFMRFGGNTAFVEGWALYAETLWPELGMETDPYQRFGGLNDEMLRAMRLVVDSGIHAMGWTRDQAITYMTTNSAMGKADVTAEVERYIAIPGQALAYKVGQLTILKEKAKAKAALGAKFDPRAFHAQVLDTGALPMTVLEKKIDDWIAQQKGR
ncbi:DUF885 domain-containing protein [Sphingomonas sp. PR090111-T3T-6A]|uniref:DUF885 domain-containing protein n=1 Tax=Sphingomonas sp. PR090111-T3T-6A TaxID=685778 RepID=UPI000364664F|nr:DUF885 domain-containing protein [Sphingomonas sp. PR090111-T3T-6A]